MQLISLSVLLLLGPFTVLSNELGEYNVGVGIADVTGPVADINMMGYANLEQSARGLHTRLFSRAFIFQSMSTTPIEDPSVTTTAPPPPPEPQPLVVFVSADIGMVDQAVKFSVVEKLKLKYPDGTFSEKNVLLSGTHTHSGPGAFLQYILYSITSLGFYKPSLDAIVDGMVESIEKAYNNLQPGKIYINNGKVEGANINRSPTAYLNNPEEERDQYEDGDVDKNMVLLRIETSSGKPLGSINWFAVHPTSMNNTNKLISGDNKGYASMLFEYEMNPGIRPGKGEFVSAFASSNLGDVSPNTDGPKCQNTGLPCSENSTCPDDTLEVKWCYALGPGSDMEDSTKIIGKKQYDVARSLFRNTNEEAQMLTGPTGFVHQYVNMPNYELKPSNISREMCKPALGFSFAAGTTDGPGMFNFVQGDTNATHPFWDLIKKITCVSPICLTPSPELAACHSPKPILLPVGDLNTPHAWVASTVETQILRVGNLFILGFPGELTTMAGRRLRKAVDEIVSRTTIPPSAQPQVVIAGLSNVYTHYITTYEEYQVQRYEAASTLYGPHTLEAYMEIYSNMADHLLKETQPVGDDAPDNLIEEASKFSLITKIQQDKAPLMKSFGNVLLEVPVEVRRSETVKVKFVGGHPRNNVMRGGTFLVVEQDVGEDRWKVIATDADWSTKFRWSRPKFLSSESVIEISWEVPENAQPGFYRIRHFGYYKPDKNSALKGYQGTSAVFKVTVPGRDTQQTHPEWIPNRTEHKKPPTIFTSADFWYALASIVKKGKVVKITT